MRCYWCPGSPWLTSLGDASAHFVVMCGWSRWLWQRRRTTPHEDRRLPQPSEEVESYSVPRHQKTPPPGMRAKLLVEPPGSQLWSGAPRCPDLVDSSLLALPVCCRPLTMATTRRPSPSFLLQQTFLVGKKEDEEEARRKEKEGKERRFLVSIPGA